MGEDAEKSLLLLDLLSTIALFSDLTPGPTLKPRTYEVARRRHNRTTKRDFILLTIPWLPNFGCR